MSSYSLQQEIAMTIEEIKELIRVVQETGIAKLEVQRGENKVEITNTITNKQEVVLPTVVSVPVSTAASPVAPVAVGAHEIQAPAVPAVPPAAKEEDRYFVVKSPIVGTYYDAAAPGEAPFVRVGDQVQAKQVLCIIESMKLMNEIESEIAGTIVAKLVENGRPVEYGESLFTIRPS
jgi:acetyl-CoA carboxylase biotin carboxyl carrier protein